MKDINYILSRLNKVSKSGLNKWRACCPGHGGKDANMAVKLTDEGHILFRCHSHQCGIEDILAGAGLDWNDVMPEERNQDTIKPNMPNMPYGDGLKALKYESQIVLASAYMMRAGTLTQNDLDRLEVSMNRVHNVMRECGL